MANNIQSKNIAVKNNSGSSFYSIWLTFMAAGVIPLLIELVITSAGLSEYDWFSGNDTEYDFFLVCKMLGIVSVAIIMLGIIIWNIIKKSSIYTGMYKENKVIFICLCVYTLFAFLSSCLADSPQAAFTGGYAQHEPFPVLFGYIVFAIFAYFFTSGSGDILRLLKLLMWGVAIISYIGLLQFLAIDFFNTDTGKSLITMFSDIDASRITLSFGEGRVYMTLYNPNYVGSYVALVIPVMIAGVYVMEKIWQKLLMGINAALLIVCLIGSESTTGMSAIALSFILVMILCIPRLKEYGRYIGILFAGAVIVIVFVCIVKSDSIMEAVNKYTLTEDIRLLTGMEIGDDEIRLTYKNRDMYVKDIPDEAGNMQLIVYDENHNELPFYYHPDTNLIGMDDEEYRDIVFSRTMTSDSKLGFNIICGPTFTLAHDMDDDRYYFYNPYGKKTRDVVNSARIGFEGHESFASNRGFIWSRSVPLLAEHMLFGCGPDNFVREFPNNDYVSMYNNTYQGQIVTRPHNMYLQIGVQTGVISLIAVVMMYIVYFVQSVRLLWKNNKITMAYILSMSFLVGSFAYMICGFANDSTLGVAPVFWTFIGLGLACNRILKKEMQ